MVYFIHNAKIALEMEMLFMIRHIVLFRLKDKSPEKMKATAELFYSLRDR